MSEQTRQDGQTKTGEPMGEDKQEFPALKMSAKELFDSIRKTYPHLAHLTDEEIDKYHSL